MNLSASRIYMLLWLIGVAVVMVLANIAAHIIYPYTSDGLIYIEAAQNLIAGKGLMVTPFDPAPYDVDVEPLRLFPPGYPILIAGLSLLGFDVAKAALGISLFSWAALLPAIVFCLRPLIGVIPASICGLLTILSSPAFLTGPMVVADVPFLLATCICLGVLFRSVGEELDWKGIFLAGMLAGLAYSLRNAGLAILLSISVALVLAASMRLLTLRASIASLGLWWAGALPVLALLWARNIALFGKLQPYSHPPADAGLLQIVRNYCDTLLFALTGSHTIRMFAWDFKLLALTAFPVAAATAWLLTRRWSQLKPQVRFAILAIVFYIVIGSAMVVLAHYIMGAHDYGTGRYAMQYAWLIWALVAIAGCGIKWRRHTIRAIALAAVLFSLLVSQAHFIYDFSHKKPYGRKLLLADGDLLGSVRTIPDNALILTNLVGFLKLETGRHVRNLEISGMPDIRAYAGNLSNALEDVAQKTDRPVYGVILPLDRFLAPDLADKWQDAVLATLPGDFALMRRTKNMLLVQRISGRPPSLHAPIVTGRIATM